VLLGGGIIVQSAIVHEWIGILIGGYFGSMGLFALGCAANCSRQMIIHQTKRPGN
jgi:uncharacterized membrane protein YedE/YeeE